MPKIKKLYAWVIPDKDDNDEGVPAVQMPDGMIMPLMGSDMPRVEAIRQLAQQAANKQQKPIKLMVSTGLKVIDTIQPEPQNNDEGNDDADTTTKAS